LVAFAVLLLGGATGPLQAQDAGSEVVDRVVAVVGSTPILRSQVDEEVFARYQAPNSPPSDPAALRQLRRTLVDTLIFNELMYQAAQKDTMIKVTDQEVNDAVEALVRSLRKQIISEVDFTNELKNAGFQSQDEWRRMLQEQQRKALVIGRYRERLRDENKLKPKAPTEREMRAFYQALKDTGRLPPVPTSVSVKQIVVAPRPSEQARAASKALADSIVTELRKGADFAVAARRFSMDPSSRENGGDLGWFRRGTMVREFEQVAFALKPGTVSDPVESPFGWHIIQVQRVQPTEVQARHILIMPPVDSADEARARARALEIYNLVSAGASFDSLQREAHDPGEEKEISSYPVDSLLPAYAKALAGVDTAQVTTPFPLEIPGQPFRTKWAVVKVIKRTPAGDLSYETAKERIRDLLGRQLGENAFLEELRAKTYVDVRDP
ncbi:MAG: peptidylprolyl isomerase, partial [Gemmatimonadota bacterium]